MNPTLPHDKEPTPKEQEEDKELENFPVGLTDPD